VVGGSCSNLNTSFIGGDSYKLGWRWETVSVTTPQFCASAKYLKTLSVAKITWHLWRTQVDRYRQEQASDWGKHLRQWHSDHHKSQSDVILKFKTINLVHPNYVYSKTHFQCAGMLADITLRFGGGFYWPNRFL